MSDIFTDLKETMATMMAGDSFFTGAPGVPVIAEDRVELVKELSTRLGKIGACVVIGEPTVTRRGNHDYDVSMVISVFEHTLINRGPKGSQKTGNAIGMHCWSILEGWQPDIIWQPLALNRWEPMRMTDQPMARELEVHTSCIAHAVQDDDQAKWTTGIYAPHTDGGCVPLRLTGQPGAYQWEFGVKEDIGRRPLYAEHEAGVAIPVGVTGPEGAWQWVYGMPSPYLGGIEHFAPLSAGGIVPIQLIGEIGKYQWKFGEME